MEANLIIKDPVALSYWKILRNLGVNVKKDLILLLVDSIPETKPDSPENWADKFYGAWQDDKSPEELINQIRESRILI